AVGEVADAHVTPCSGGDERPEATHRLGAAGRLRREDEPMDAAARIPALQRKHGAAAADLDVVAVGPDAQELRAPAPPPAQRLHEALPPPRPSRGNLPPPPCGRA